MCKCDSCMLSSNKFKDGWISDCTVGQNSS
jgi:hypothetical protein